jgi:hypothetical protein
MVDTNLYELEYDVCSNTVNIYGFSNNIDARTGNVDDQYAVF